MCHDWKWNLWPLWCRGQCSNQLNHTARSKISVFIDGHLFCLYNAKYIWHLWQFLFMSIPSFSNCVRSCLLRILNSFKWIKIAVSGEFSNVVEKCVFIWEGVYVALFYSIELWSSSVIVHVKTLLFFFMIGFLTFILFQFLGIPIPIPSYFRIYFGL